LAEGLFFMTKTDVFFFTKTEKKNYIIKCIYY